MRTVFRVIMVIGMVILFGTAGASDLDLLTAGQEITRSAVGLLMMVAGFTFGRAWEVK